MIYDPSPSAVKLYCLIIGKFLTGAGFTCLFPFSHWLLWVTVSSATLLVRALKETRA